MQKKLSRRQIQDIMDVAPKDMATDVIIKGLVDRGFILEGFNEPKNDTGIVREIGASIVKPFENIANTAMDNWEAGIEHVGTKLGTKMGLRTDDNKLFGDRVKEKALENSNITKMIDPNQDTTVRDLSTFKGVKQAAGDVVEAGANFIPVGKVAQGAGLMAKVGVGLRSGAAVGGTVGIGQGMQNDEGIMDIGYRALQSAAVGGAVGGTLPLGQAALQKGTEKVAAIPGGVKKVATDFTQGIEDATESTKASLNPFKSESTDAVISIPKGNGLFVLKKVPEVTQEERDVYQKYTGNLFNTMLEKAKKFAKDRRDSLSPLEIVGENTDKAISTVNELRKQTGARMGEIEKGAEKLYIDLSNSPLDEFMQRVKEKADGGGYAGSGKLTAESEQFLQDLGTLQKRGLSVKEVLSFTRDWDKKLKNLKDGFGKFKDNAYDNTVLEQMVVTFKNQARNTLANVDETYKQLVSQYRITSKIRDEGNRLMGKEGMSGEKIKGAATAKRAVQSNSDGGARQFYNTLKQLTGYDGLQEADIAIQAMKEAGDYQGLSLLEVSKDILDKKEINWTNPISAIWEGTKYAVKMARPDSEQRTKNFINQSNLPVTNTLIKKDSTVRPTTAKIIPPAISNIKESIKDLLKKGNTEELKTLLSGLEPYMKSQLIKLLTAE